jgi:hypothetical protein
VAGFGAGLTITPGGTAYAAINVPFVTSLYTLDLTTGAATIIGPLGPGGAVRAITLVP